MTATETTAVVSQTAAPRPGAQAAAPALIVTPEAADLIDARVARASGRAAVVVAGGRSGEILYATDADAPVFAASLYKLGVLLEAERRIDAGTLSVTDVITVTAADQLESGSFTAAGTILTVDEALERTITLSDNASALALIRKLGVARIQTTLDREQIYLRFTADGAMTTARGIVLVVLTWDSDEQDGIDLIKEIARLAYEGLART